MLVRPDRFVGWRSPGAADESGASSSRPRCGRSSARRSPSIDCDGNGSADAARRRTRRHASLCGLSNWPAGGSMSKKQGGGQRSSPIKIAPPRARRWVVSRERLVRKFQSVRECALICVQAPAGYGKTSLLARMRREWLAAGACAAWLALDENDDAGRFVEALLLSTYTALGRPGAGPRRSSRRFAAPSSRAKRSPTLLGELAGRRRRPTALVLDDVHALPEAVGAELLPYLAFNLPPNVHLILGTRRRLPFATSELLAHGQFALVRRRGPDLPSGGDARAAARALRRARRCRHGGARARAGRRLADGAAARARRRREGAGPGRRRCAASRRAGSGLDTLFADVILPRLDPEDVAFLTAVAPLEQLQAHLCAAVTGRRDCAELLERLRNDTPVLQAVEGSEWLRLHATCRDALLRRFDDASESRPAGDALAGGAMAARRRNARTRRASRAGRGARRDRLRVDRAGALRAGDLGPRRRGTQTGWSDFPRRSSSATTGCASSPHGRAPCRTSRARRFR